NQKTFHIKADSCDPIKVFASFSSSIGGNLHKGETLVKGENLTWQGVKGKYGYWGSLIFHLSFIVILAGIVLSVYYGFYGSLLITEGQKLNLNSMESYVEINRRPLGGVSLDDLEVNLKKFERIYQNGKFTDYIATTELFSAGYKIENPQVKVNQPLKFRGTKLVLDQYGYAPLFTIRDKSGTIIQEAYFNLKVLTTVQTDSISLPDGKTVNLRFFPDFEKKGQNVRTKSEFPQNPVFVTKWDQNKGLLFLGKSLQVGDWEITFSNLSYWVLFRVAKDPGEPVIYIGFLISLAGIGLRLLFPRVGYRVSIKGDKASGYTGEISISARGITGQPDNELDRAVKKIKLIAEKE
ncbi:MAG TPA: cytochrome c biogenesis protein ResB, partial [Desulfobacteria bacterium]|nr:cytochrome c biogenesis protein ResB [Desulfobacteria bacterium]